MQLRRATTARRRGPASHAEAGPLGHTQPAESDLLVGFRALGFHFRRFAFRFGLGVVFLISLRTIVVFRFRTLHVLVGFRLGVVLFICFRAATTFIARASPRRAFAITRAVRWTCFAVAWTARRTFTVSRTSARRAFPIARPTWRAFAVTRSARRTGFATWRTTTFAAFHSFAQERGRAGRTLAAHFVHFGPQTLNFRTQFTHGMHHVLHHFGLRAMWSWFTTRAISLRAGSPFTRSARGWTDWTMSLSGRVTVVQRPFQVFHDLLFLALTLFATFVKVPQNHHQLVDDLMRRTMIRRVRPFATGAARSPIPFARWTWRTRPPFTVTFPRRTRTGVSTLAAWRSRWAFAATFASGRSRRSLFAVFATRRTGAIVIFVVSERQSVRGFVPLSRSRPQGRPQPAGRRHADSGKSQRPPI